MHVIDEYADKPLIVQYVEQENSLSLDCEVKVMPIKFADDIIKEIINRGEISVKNNCVTGEEFEKWLRREKEVNGNTYLIDEKQKLQ